MCNKSSSPSGLTIFWEAPSHDLGEVLGYLVEVKELQSKPGSKDIVLVDVTEFNIKVEEAFLSQGLSKDFQENLNVL